MPDARSEVQVVISGTAVGLEHALQQAQAALGGFGAQADKAAAQAGGHLAAGEREAGREALSLGEHMGRAAEMVSRFGTESNETFLRLQGFGGFAREAREGFGGLGGAVSALAGSFLLFKSFDVAKESVQEAMDAQVSWNRLQGATQERFEQTKKAIEENAAGWEKIGISQGKVAAMAAAVATRVTDLPAVLDPRGLGAVARVLGTDIPTALDQITRPRGGMQVLSRMGLSPNEMRIQLAHMRNMNAQQRAVYLEQLALSKFGPAPAGAEKTFAAFGAVMADLREELGTALLPAVTSFAQGLITLLQAVQAAAQPFGGLAHVLERLFLPMMGLGLLLFTNLRGVMTRLVDMLLGRLVGAFSQTAESVAEADVEARTLAADISAIPETVTTTAAFVPATAIKDAYKANIFSIPTAWTTTAVFEPAAVKQPVVAGVGVGTAAISVPIVAKNTLNAAEVVKDAEAITKAAAAKGAAIKVPITEVVTVSAPGRVRSALTGALKSTGVVIEAVDHVTNRVSGIIAGAQRYAATHPIKSVLSGVGTTTTLAAGFAVSEAIFNGAVTFNKVSMPSGPKVTWSAADQDHLNTLLKKFNAPLKVHVEGGKLDNVNVGTLGPALVGGHFSPEDRSLLQKQIAALDAQKTAAEKYAKAIEDAHKHPLPVDVHFNAAEMAKMVGEVALGTIIANIFTKILDPSKILGFIKGGALNIGSWLSGKGVGTAAAAGDASAEARAINDLMRTSGLSSEDAVAAASKYLKSGGTVVEPPPSGGSGAPKSPTTPLVEPMMPTAGYAAWMWGAVPIKDKHGKFTGHFRPSTPEEDMKSNKALGENIQALGKWIVGEFVSGGKANAKQSQDLGGQVIGSFVEGIKHHWPSIFPWIFGGERPKQGALSIGGHNYPEYVRAGTKTPTAPKGYEYVATGKSDYPYRLEQQTRHGAQPIPGDFIGRYGGGRLAPALIGQLHDIVAGAGAATHPGRQVAAHAQALHPAVAAHQAAGAHAAHAGPAHQTSHNTYNATFHIHAASDAQAVARQVNHAFSEFVQGARATKRLHG